MMKKNFPVAMRIILWICIAHLWIIICTLAYVNLEGVEPDAEELEPIKESDLLLKVLSDLEIGISDIKNDTTKRKIFQNEYETRLKDLKQWSNRGHFNDVSRSYVFVLLAHTGIGNHGDMELQTWQSQLFYLFTMPFGLLFYYVMIHQIAVEVFEVYAFATVATFERHRYLDWTIDQRELHEKIIVFLFTLLIFIVSMYTFGFIGLLCGASYIEGAYRSMNMMFLVSGYDTMFSFKYVPNSIVAFVMTLLVFVAVFMVYMVLYSSFLVFRYNNIKDLSQMIFMYATADSMSDVTGDVENLELEHEELEQTADHEFWWDEGRKSILTYSKRLPQKDEMDFPGDLKPRYRRLYSTSTESNSENEFLDADEIEDVPKYERDKQTKHFSQKLPPLFIPVKEVQPQIKITQPTPSPEKTLTSTGPFDKTQ